MWYFTIGGEYTYYNYKYAGSALQRRFNTRRRSTFTAFWLRPQCHERCNITNKRTSSYLERHQNLHFCHSEASILISRIPGAINIRMCHSTWTIECNQLLTIYSSLQTCNLQNLNPVAATGFKVRISQRLKGLLNPTSG